MRRAPDAYLCRKSLAASTAVSATCAWALQRMMRAWSPMLLVTGASAHLGVGAESCFDAPPALRDSDVAPGFELCDIAELRWGAWRFVVYAASLSALDADPAAAQAAGAALHAALLVEPANYSQALARYRRQAASSGEWNVETSLANHGVAKERWGHLANFMSCRPGRGAVRPLPVRPRLALGRRRAGAVCHPAGVVVAARGGRRPRGQLRQRRPQTPPPPPRGLAPPHGRRTRWWCRIGRRGTGCRGRALRFVPHPGCQHPRTPPGSSS